MNFLIEVYPTYLKRKNLIKNFLIDWEAKLLDLHKKISKEYEGEEDDIFDFGDFTHQFDFYSGKRPHHFKIHQNNEKLKILYPKIRKMTYVFDLGEQHTFRLTIRKATKQEEVVYSLD